MLDSMDAPSTRPYLIRALYEWCTDSGFTPFIAVQVDDAVRVPMEFVKDGEIVLNVSFDATSALKLGNEYIEFKGRFGGVARDILVPVDHVLAIYARENGQGMAFPLSTKTPNKTQSPDAEGVKRAPGAALTAVDAAQEADPEPTPPKSPAPASRPALTRIK
ncbi:MAG: ClpXP protease specificity-enhancing factor [Rhodoferax sp.]|uniref:ClpXP protease specificity-enhancing factor n=1 Tax=Rhodoferax sp. TaxID=50421 RepID=UPI002ACE1BA0|nr:ClpXP protease specificity-enhancing factor [Rhodoferax sp.]MDZ7891317.1 ClpXP protease specificity-enhancing factor [Rhodoferax sp.]